MIVYVGDTRSRKLLAVLAARGIGQVAIRGRLNGRRLDPWFYDNGAFEDWRAGRDFDADTFTADLARMRGEAMRPDFIVCPDKPAAPDSLEYSRAWRTRLEVTWPVYLAVQDGMRVQPETVAGFGGVFLGGTDLWKRRTAPEWADLARVVGLPFHYARCGTTKKVAQAKAIGADSLDSSLPLWSKENLRRFLDALDQCQLFDEGRDG